MIPKRPDVVPCKRPKVTVETYFTVADLRQQYEAVCSTGTCTWTYRNSAKTDAQEQAKRHRAEHRMAVPSASAEVRWVKDEQATGPKPKRAARPSPKRITKPSPEAHAYTGGWVRRGGVLIPTHPNRRTA